MGAREINIFTRETELNLPSRIESIALLEAFITDVFDRYGLPKNLFGNAMVALMEATNNAILHGNGLNPDTWVKIIFRNTDYTFSFIVIDEGTGFNYNHIPDPTSKDNLYKESGRGLFLIKSLSDNLSFFEKGSILELTFNKNSNGN